MVSPGGPNNGGFPYIFCIDLQVLKHSFLAFSQGLGGFREVRQAGRNHFHLSWYLSNAVVTSYGQIPGGGVSFYRVRYKALRQNTNAKILT